LFSGQDWNKYEKLCKKNVQVHKLDRHILDLKGVIKVGAHCHTRQLALIAASLCLLSAGSLSTAAYAGTQTVDQSITQLRHHHKMVDTRGLKTVSSTDARQPDLASSARSAEVVDFATGKVLFKKDEHEKMPIASITKIMTMLLILEAVDDGKIKLTDKVRASEYAASMGGSQIFLEPGESMTVNDMLKGIAIASANDACVAMAEQLYGSEEAFVAKMNERAKELGMNDTHFENCNGLPADGHYSSAHDIALMSRSLLNHQEITKWTSVYSDYLRKDTSHPLWLVNTNKLVRFYDGMDGLKTGYTQEAKYCLAATARRDGFRVISVVLGEPRMTTRNKDVTQLMNWAFSQYQSKVLYQAGEVVERVRVTHGIPNEVSVKTANPVGVIHPKGQKLSYETKIETGQLKAPLKAGQQVGRLLVVDGKKVIAETSLLACSDVKKANMWQSFGQTLRRTVTFGSK
jgi:serine-type D-Ala-D-Ala carboxypeptidase (penicillin-binding protein 5/6)